MLYQLHNKYVLVAANICQNWCSVWHTWLPLWRTKVQIPTQTLMHIFSFSLSSRLQDFINSRQLHQNYQFFLSWFQSDCKKSHSWAEHNSLNKKIEAILLDIRSTYMVSIVESCKYYIQYNLFHMIAFEWKDYLFQNSTNANKLEYLDGSWSVPV